MKPSDDSLPTPREGSLKPRSKAGKGRRGEDPRVVQTREFVYAATLEALPELGIRGLTIERIAEKSGVARSTIYRRWPNLSQLYLEAFAQYARQQPLEPSGNTARDLESYLTVAAERLNDPTYRAILVAILDRAARDDDFAELHQRIFDEKHSRAAAVLRAGIRSGAIKKGTDMADALAALRGPLLYISLVRHERIQPSDVQRVLADFLSRFSAPAAPTS